MGRIRTIKPEFFLHEELYEAEVETGLPLRLAYIALWTVADREGRFRVQPKVLKLACLPHDDVDFSRVLDALATRGWLVLYASGTRQYAYIPSFKDHQIINHREHESKIPAPEDCEKTTREPPVNDPSTTREARVDLASVTREARVGHAARGEGKGKGTDIREGKGIHPTLLMDKFVKAMKITHEELLKTGQGWIGFAGTYNDWIQAGCTEEDIWQTVERVGTQFIAKHGSPPKATNYFTKAVLEAKEFRSMMPAPAPKPEQIPVPGPRGTTTVKMLDVIVEGYTRHGAWELTLSEVLPFMPGFTFPEPWLSKLKAAPIPRHLKLYDSRTPSGQPYLNFVDHIHEAHREALSQVEA